MKFSVRIVGLLEAARAGGLRDSNLEGYSPAERQRWADGLRYIADVLDPPTKVVQPRTGVLAELHRGYRGE